MSSWVVVGLACGSIMFFIGRQSGLNGRAFREELDELNEHYRKLEEPAFEEEAAGVTSGTYGHVDEVSAETRNPERTTGVVKPKSPKTLEREALERMNVASEKWGLTEKDD